MKRIIPNLGIICLVMMLFVACEESNPEDDPGDTATGEWTLVGTSNFLNKSVSDVEIALANDGTPYVVYQLYDNDEIRVQRFSGTAWEAVGSDNLAQTTGDQPDMIIAQDGTPYVTFQDEDVSDEITVMKYTNGAWEVIGERGISPSDGSNPDIVISSEGVPVVAFYGWAVGAAWVYGYNGSTWGPVGTSHISGYGEEPQLVIDSNDQLYLMRSSGNETDLYTYEGSSWDAVGAHTFGLVDEASWIESVILELDSGMNPVVTFSNPEESLTTLSWNGSEWVGIASPYYTDSEYGAFPEDMVIDDQDNIYVALEDDSYANFMMYDGNDWSRLGTQNLSEVVHMRLVQNTSGGLFVAIIDYDDLLSVYHFE